MTGTYSKIKMLKNSWFLFFCLVTTRCDGGVWFAKDTTTRDSLPPLTIWKFYLRYCLRKNVNKQKHKILKILRPEETDKKIPLIFLHFLFKVRPYIFLFQNRLKRVWEKMTEKNNNRKLYTILLRLTSRSSMP